MQGHSGLMVGTFALHILVGGVRFSPLLFVHCEFASSPCASGVYSGHSGFLRHGPKTCGLTMSLNCPEWVSVCVVVVQCDGLVPHPRCFLPCGIGSRSPPLTLCEIRTEFVLAQTSTTLNLPKATNIPVTLYQVLLGKLLSLVMSDGRYTLNLDAKRLFLPDSGSVLSEGEAFSPWMCLMCCVYWSVWIGCSVASDILLCGLW